ncbi:MAG: DUF2779 domain-containing protein [Methanoregula sp.]|nr:DUF2779 domain-containing protein [Methanoregula sp.]
MPPVDKNIFVSTVFCSTLGWRLRSGVIRPEFTAAQKFWMEQGKKVHAIARDLFPSGIFVSGTGAEAAAAQTQELIANPVTRVIFEAAFSAGNYRTKADILIREAGGFSLIEIKSGINAKEEHVDDMAYTTLVAQAAGFSPSSVRLMLIDKNYRLGMPDERLFTTTDMTGPVLTRVGEFRAVMNEIDASSGAPQEPAPQLTWNCRSCEYFGECLGRDGAAHIFTIPRLRQDAAERLIAAGITTVQQIPDGFRLSDPQRRVVECVRSGTVQVDPSLRQKLAAIRYPASYLDFETMMTALPLWPGVAPYEHIPVQYSLHVRNAPGSEISHREYLADPARDCRRELAERLIADLTADGVRDGSIITYSSFEKTTIAALARRFPDLAGDLLSLTRRIVDLEPCIKCISHPQFCGRTSIKVVLPVLVPDLSYDGLAIGNGDDALVTFAMMAQGMMTPEEMAGKQAELLEYCERDTLAMVRLHEVLRGFVGS